MFDPDERTIGWTQTFEPYRIYPKYKGVVTRIENNTIIYLDDDRGGFHWECFKKV